MKSRLTEAAAVLIFADRTTPAALLGKKYGVSEKAIRDVRMGRTWAYTTGVRSCQPKRGRPLGSKDAGPRALKRRKRKTGSGGLIDDQLYAWARKRFVLKRLFADDGIEGLDE